MPILNNFQLNGASGETVPPIPTVIRIVLLHTAHSAVADTSKTVPGKSWLKFKNRDDQSTTLSILVKNLEPSITINWSKFRPKNEA